MIRADSLLSAGHWSGEASDAVTLDYAARFRRRRRMSSDGGVEFLLDLAEATEMRAGDGLRLEDGRILVIVAAPEPVADLAAADGGGLVRLAWHLGNRHLPTQILDDRLRIRQDAVIEAMATRLGATVTRLEAPFDPEGGAYGRGRTHGHSHGGEGRQDASHDE